MGWGGFGGRGPSRPLPTGTDAICADALASVYTGSETLSSATVFARYTHRTLHTRQGMDSSAARRLAIDTQVNWLAASGTATEFGQRRENRFAPPG